jgi:hypothetical protein
MNVRIELSLGLIMAPPKALVYVTFSGALPGRSSLAASTEAAYFRKLKWTTG